MEENTIISEQTTLNLADENVKTSKISANNTKKGKLLITIIIIAVLLIAVIVSIILFGKGGNKGDNKEIRFAKIAATALETDITSKIGGEIVLNHVYVKKNDTPTEYKNDFLSEYNYTDIVARVYIDFFIQNETAGKTSISPMTCCIFVDTDETANIIYHFDDDTIKNMYRSSAAGSEYGEYILIAMVKNYHFIYDNYFPSENELQEWTEIPVKDGQKDLSIDEILG
ncbi:MAG: hypothetical protein IJL25_10045 [Clostridia bacterium]|nr:hypothetical protein [Clostridia bacterium]